MNVTSYLTPDVRFWSKVMMSPKIFCPNNFVYKIFQVKQKITFENVLGHKIWNQNNFG